MKVLFKKFDEKAVVPFKTYDSDFCYDVVATSCKEIAPNVYKYGLGFGLQIQRKKFEPRSLFCISARPRSSVYKTGMVLSNAVGTIDEGYTNEISFVFYHVLPNMPKYEVGDKIGQIYVSMTKKIDFVETKQLNETDRGLNGYGSTGK